MVMGYHAGVPGFDGSFIGLDLFFVVSGFVIAGLLLGEFERTSRIRWSAFYARRARRLIPAKATMLIGVLILSYFVMATPGLQQDTARSAAAAAAFVSNFFFWQIADVNYFANEPGTGVLLHTWSLSVEEQFYLALPLGVMLAYGLARLLKVHIGRTLMFIALALGIASLWGAMTLADSVARGGVLHADDPGLRVPDRRGAGARRGQGRRAGAGCGRSWASSAARICVYLLLDPMPTDGYPQAWALLPCAARS